MFMQRSSQESQENFTNRTKNNCAVVSDVRNDAIPKHSERCSCLKIKADCSCVSTEYLFTVGDSGNILQCIISRS